ncbi:hypothetical protein PMAYCL1PPCAC_14952 [Pristionchus mayeri]|uniref:G-protein coupled receptors family 1 profile domain-containing protein n=1 Tax=Pristionchus mayeri TaxID=1317129 RepID=A0AAN5HXD6_9BILA|nr:hypothetical protein PMAYCL1PPCAC_14952 [Pristionchus mayeri]
MALNRLVVFIDSPIRPLFSMLHGLFRDYVGLTTLGCWFLVIVLSAYTELLARKSIFNRTSLDYEISGPPLIDSPFLETVNTISDYVIPFVIMGIYIVVYAVIRKKRMSIVGGTASSSDNSSSTARSKPPDDRKLLYQAIIITIFLQVSVIQLFYLSINDL